MSRAFYSRKYSGAAATATATFIIIPNFDISHLDKFCLLYQNNNTATNSVSLIVEASLDAGGSAADTPSNWVQINTGTLVQPSALTNTSSRLTSAADNVYHWLRLKASYSATQSTTLDVTIAGFQRA